MSQAIFARAVQAGLAKLGEPSLLDGLDVGKVNIERAVDLFVGDPDDGNDSSIAQADVATILASYAPRVGQTLSHPDGDYKLMRLAADNGYTRSFVIVPA